ncbi:glutathione S-transferase family protein [Sphingomonas oligophenolica]|uniref:Glutathione S-transferase family protein n=1 Tax=Sphingomonas oligophenolica TaxID=301154 RepID=A0A502CPB3_9SPHN|nr:glutathione S-transferase family protein [Sphingomonas oligophenolica]TPG14494.1 glutathione S-transferase family protein [Sphingomonas oligophenolica]
MKLYDAEWAPSPRRVRVYLAEKGIEVERVPVDLRRDEQLGDAYLTINPRGAVPALQLDDSEVPGGAVICESAAICRYFEAVQPEPSLFGRTPIEIARIESWTRRIESDGYAAAVYALRNAAPAFADRAVTGKWPAVPQIPELSARALIMWGAFTEAMDQRLATSEWIAGDVFSFADITGLITIDFAARAGLAMPDGAANLRRWHDAVSARPSATA